MIISTLKHRQIGERIYMLTSMAAAISVKITGREPAILFGRALRQLQLNIQQQTRKQVIRISTNIRQKTAQLLIPNQPTQTKII